MGEARERLPVLFEEAQACTRCASMKGRPRVLGAKNGTAAARCLVVAEAPGKEGAARRGAPLTGDHTGAAFDELLAGAKIRRSEIFITNACLCSPVDAKKAPRPPSDAELKNCSYFVKELIATLDPGLVVTLGATALAALARVSPHDLQLKWAAGEPHRWYGRFVLPLYHPGPRAMIQRPLARQKKDYAAWRALLSGEVPS